MNMKNIEQRWLRAQFTKSVRNNLYRKLATLLTNNVSIQKAIPELHKRAYQRRRNSALSTALAQCRKRIENGKSFAEAMENWISPTERDLFAAAEMAGNLPDALYNAVRLNSAGQGIQREFAKALTYPIGIFAVGIVTMFLMSAYMIPTFAKILPPAKWQGAAASLYSMSNFVVNWIWLVVFVVIVLFATIGISMPHWTGRLRTKFDRFPPWNMYRMLTGSGFLLSLSALLKAGVKEEDALFNIARTASPYLRSRLQAARKHVVNGDNTGVALDKTKYQFPSSEIIDDLALYANYANFDKALTMTADEWIANGTEWVARQAKIVNYSSMLLIGMWAGWLAIGLFALQIQISNIAF